MEGLDLGCQLVGRRAGGLWRAAGGVRQAAGGGRRVARLAAGGGAGSDADGGYVNLARDLPGHGLGHHLKHESEAARLVRVRVEGEGEGRRQG